MIAAFFTGLLMSFFGSIAPTGPIALIVLRRGLSRQNTGALSLASGAAVAEAAYALLAYLGINFALSHYPIQISILRMAAGIVLMVFAALCIFSRTPRKNSASRNYAGANFLLGLSIAGLNPTYLVTWAGAMAVIRSMGLILDIYAAPAFALGVAGGPILWFWIFLKVLTGHVERFRPETLGIIEKVLPVILLTIAGVFLAQGIIAIVGQK